MTVRIFEPEGGRLEFKSADSGNLPEDIWKTVSAFSNTDGGTILFGIDDNGYEIGLDNQEIDKIQKDFVSLCNTSFNHRVQPTITVVDGHVSAIIDPLPATMRPLFSKSRGMEIGTYIRVGSVNQRASSENIRCFLTAAQGGAETTIYDGDYHEILDSQRIKNYIGLLNSRNANVYQRFSEEEVLRKQKVLIGDKMSLFGLLVFGEGLSLQEIVAPTINIAVTQYPGADKVSGDATLAYIDSKEFNGCVVEQFENALAFIKSKLPVRGVVGPDGKRQDYLIIPEVAIREALANAVVHRDYAAIGSRIQVDIYSNRIEMINPGRSLVPIEEIESTQSVTRNPLTMNFFKENGYTEQKARGIRTIKQTVREAGLKTPMFENLASQSFRVTLFTSAFISIEEKDWLEQFAKFNLKDRQLNCLVFLNYKPKIGISNGEYRELNNMNSVGDDKMANRELRAMVELGILRAEGQGKARKYFLNV